MGLGGAVLATAGRRDSASGTFAYLLVHTNVATWLSARWSTVGCMLRSSMRYSGSRLTGRVRSAFNAALPDAIGPDVAWSLRAGHFDGLGHRDDRGAIAVTARRGVCPGLPAAEVAGTAVSATRCCRWARDAFHRGTCNSLDHRDSGPERDSGGDLTEILERASHSSSGSACASKAKVVAASRRRGDFHGLDSGFAAGHFAGR